MLERIKGFKTEVREGDVFLRTIWNSPVVLNHYGRHVAIIWFVVVRRRVAPVARSDRLCEFYCKSEFCHSMSRVWAQAVYIAVLQGSGGQPTASCLLQLSTSKCWRILWMCSTGMERFWWRSCPDTWKGQNLTSLRTWPCVLWTTWVVSVCQ